MAYAPVVRIFATTQDPAHESPWQADVPQSVTGSGVVVGPGQILTGAHVVANATFVQVQKMYDPDKAIAEVAGVWHDCDLALLRLRDPRFLAGIEPAELGELPELRDRVAVIGFPVGGEELSVTEGVVSRIEVQRYSHSQRHLLAVTVDAAINQGNSGGPVFKEGKVVGIAFQKLEGAEAVGEMVPTPIIRHVLAGIAAGAEPRIPSLGITTQTMENPSLRKRFAVPAGASGVLVLAVDHGGSAWGQLRRGDVITAIDGLAIANNGTVEFRGRHRTRYDVSMGWSSIGAEIELSILRGGAKRKVRFPLRPPAPLVPRSQYDRPPTYYIFAGLVFQALTRDFLTTWEGWWDKAPKEFLHLYYSGVRTAERHEVVVLTQVLADEINVGYDHLYSESIVALDGVMPRDVADLAARLDAAHGLVELRTSSDGVIVIDADAGRAAGPRVLHRYHIARDRSVDLVAATRPAAPARRSGRRAAPAPAPDPAPSPPRARPRTRVPPGRTAARGGRQRRRGSR
jgi:S1-C subfamily serine protease